MYAMCARETERERTQSGAKCGCSPLRVSFASSDTSVALIILSRNSIIPRGNIGTPTLSHDRTTEL